MGRSFWYECSKCGYRTQVSGGADEGRHFAVQTVVCHDCRALFDAVTRFRVADDSPLSGGKHVGIKQMPRWLSGPHAGPAPTLAQAVNRLPPRGVRRFKWLQFKPACPVSPVHRVEPWNDPGKCPRCGVLLERNALPYRLWE